MLKALHRLALGAFRLLPTSARRLVVRSLSPTFTAGAIAVILDDSDRMLLVRQTYRGRWGLPGGLMKRGELPLDALRREVREEVGIAVVPDGEGEVVLDPEPAASTSSFSPGRPTRPWIPGPVRWRSRPCDGSPRRTCHRSRWRRRWRWSDFTSPATSRPPGITSPRPRSTPGASRWRRADQPLRSSAPGA